jgi:hypothetical protein
MHNVATSGRWLENDEGIRIPTFSENEIFWEGNPTTLYYLCSKPDRTFSVVVDCKVYLQRMCTAAYPDIQAMLHIDGIEVAAMVTDVGLDVTVMEFEGVHDGDEAIRPFRFEELVRRLLAIFGLLLMAALQRMDANGCMPSNSVRRSLGTIKVELRRARLVGPRVTTDAVNLHRLHPGPYEETSIKLKLAHIAELEQKQEVDADKLTWNLTLHPQDDARPFHCFLFRYNSREVWRASGVLGRNPRKQ